MFRNARGKPTQPHEDEAPEALAVDDDSQGAQPPIEVKRAPRLRSAKLDPDDAAD